MNCILRSLGEAHQVADDKLVHSSDLFMLAGSETTATLLLGVTYYLMRSPEVYKKATEILQSIFERPKDITCTEASQRLPYKMAYLNEALRVFLSVPLVLCCNTNPRHMPLIAGQPGVCITCFLISVPHYLNQLVSGLRPPALGLPFAPNFHDPLVSPRKGGFQKFTMSIS
jgi:hypothetical protein